jgi:thiamine-monophosphate kinase
LTAGADPAAETFADVLAAHRVPQPQYSAVLGSEGIIGSAGVAGTEAVPTALTDVSDGLIADLGHIAQASRVAIDLNSAALRDRALEAIAQRLDADAAQWILTGGEDHAFAATWPREHDVPAGWVSIGRVLAGRGVTVDGVRRPGNGGWDSFGGADAVPGPETG